MNEIHKDLHWTFVRDRQVDSLAGGHTHTHIHHGKKFVHSRESLYLSKQVVKDSPAKLVKDFKFTRKNNNNNMPSIHSGQSALLTFPEKASKLPSLADTEIAPTLEIEKVSMKEEGMLVYKVNKVGIA